MRVVFSIRLIARKPKVRGKLSKHRDTLIPLGK